eukprot:m.50945 g.50945  ORF g.50945 m.50945 type:complete len:187 (-) comp12945_c0_seq1:194-754(-)
MAAPATMSGKLGIPEATFLEDVGQFLKEKSLTAEDAIRVLEDRLRKYKFMETNLLQKKSHLKSQVPEIKSTLDAIHHLQEKKDSSETLSVDFELSANLFAKAAVSKMDKVCLWLGANVMLEYDIAEAEELLAKNHKAAQENLRDLQGDLNFLRDQITTSEVNIARVYNFDVKRRREEAAAGGSSSK